VDVRVCPLCASAKVDKVRSVGRDGDVACSNCGWSGAHKDLIGTVVKEHQIMENVLHIGGGPLALEIAEEVAATYMRLLAQDVGRPLGMALVQSGVVGVRDAESLARLIKAACRGAHKATLDEIEKMQEEIRNDKRSDAH
jgi:predicted phosphoribosyltransferase